MLAILARIFTGGFINRIFDTVDRQIESQTDRERIKGDIIKASIAARPSFMAAGGFWLMFLFAAPLAVWWASVLLYSVLWCQGCAFPQDWTVAALPPPLDEWAGAIIVSIFGVIGLSNLRK